jgi:hypothetical protein
LRAFQCRFATGGKGATSLRRRVALWKVVMGAVKVHLSRHCPLPLLLSRRAMFLHRYYDYDERKFPRGYYFNFLGIIRILKFNTATVMQKPNYIFIIEVLGREYVIR